MTMAEAATTPAMKGCYRVILTGASGYLGQQLLHAFMTSTENNNYYYHIHALYGGNTPGFVEAVQRHACAHAQSQTTVQKSSTCVVQVEALDLTDANAVQEWMVANDASFLNNNSVVCIHTAALSNPRACQKDSERAHALNVPKAFFDACISSRGFAMICLSTDQVYAGTCPPYIEEEDHAGETTTSRPTAALSPVNVYGATKLAMEQYVLQLSSNFKNNSNITKVVVLRSSIILGRKAPILPEHAHDTFLHFCASRKGMDTDFYTDERRSVVSVDDVVASIQWFVRDCLQQQQLQVSPPPTITPGNTALSTTTTASGGMIFNMGGPTSVSRFEMARAVFKHLGYDPAHLIAKEKRFQEQQQQDEQVPSPLDISMDSKKIESIAGRTFESLSFMVQKTFSNTTT
jgi:dTDP-4-dehydrorhamnose reductase